MGTCSPRTAVPSARTMGIELTFYLGSTTRSGQKADVSQYARKHPYTKTAMSTPK